VDVLALHTDLWRSLRSLYTISHNATCSTPAGTWATYFLLMILYAYQVSCEQYSPLLRLTHLVDIDQRRANDGSVGRFR
jgi:hypothetical protein